MSGVNLPTDSVSTPMTMNQNNAINFSNAFNRIVTDIAASGTSGVNHVQAGSALDNDLKNAEALTYQLSESAFAPQNEMNQSAQRFTGGAYAALVNFAQDNQMGTASLKSLETLSKNVVLALSPLTGSPPPAAATPAGGSPVGGTAGGGTTGGMPVGGGTGAVPVGGTPGGVSTAGKAGYEAVKTDLQNEARATTSTEKAHFVSQAITDLIAALGGGGAASPAGGPASGPATAGGATAPTKSAGAMPTAAGGAAPPMGAAAAPTAGTIPTPVASELLKATNLASGLVQQSSAPESVKSSLQNTLASLVASIAGSTRAGAIGSAPSNPNLTALLNALKQAADLVPKSGLSETVGNKLEDGLASLVGDIAKGAAPAAGNTTPASGSSSPQQAAGGVLQSLESVMEDLLPYLANSPANNQGLDQLAQVLEQIANATQKG